MPEANYPGTQAVTRAMSLLKSFDDDHPTWGLTDLARETGLNKTTAYRLLSALEREGMLSRGPDGETYVLGPEVVVMGGRALRNNNLRAIARPELERLAADTGETASLEILVDREMLVIDEMVGGHLMSGVPDLGSRWPLHASSTGLVVLASLPQNEALALLAPDLQSVTARTIISHDKLTAEWAAIRERGFSIADETLEIGLIAIAATVRDHDRRVVAALSVAGPKLRISADCIPEIGRQVATAAGRVSALLGYRL